MVTPSTHDSLPEFIAASHYSDPVDLKKLRFIHDAIEGYCRSTGRPAGGLALLELACGVGGITLPLATLGARVRAVDIDATDLAELVDRARKKGLDNIEATCEDAVTFDGGRAFDVVVASEVFEHLEDPGAAASNVARNMAPGSLIVDLAGDSGGNCELTRAGETVFHDGVKIIAPTHLASDMAADASQLYAKNLENVLDLLIDDGSLAIDFD